MNPSVIYRNLLLPLLMSHRCLVQSWSPLWTRPRPHRTNTLATRLASSISGSQSPRLFPEEINVLYDSKCSVCRWEMQWLAKLDESKNGQSGRKIRLTDIEDENLYNPNDPANGQVSYNKAMKSMTAVLPNGAVVQGVPVFRLAYQQVGLGWLLVVTEWPVLKTIVTWAYRIFAQYRTHITRGSSVDALIERYEERRTLLEQAAQDDCETCATKDPQQQPGQ